jgi:error-prone DNA polymerase
LRSSPFAFAAKPQAPAISTLPFPLSEVQQAYWIGRQGSFDLGNVAIVDLAFGTLASVADLAHRAELDRRDLARLAESDALAALAGHRHDAAWDVAGVERLPALIAGSTFAEADPGLPPPTEGEDIVADYRALSLTLRRHPLSLLRGKLQQRRLATAAEIAQTPHGRIVRTAGIVIGRQRPDTASGVVFVTLEDETGAINVIVWRDLGDRQRRELLGARLLAVYGKVEREGRVVHVLAGRLADLSPMLGNLETHSRDFH